MKEVNTMRLEPWDEVRTMEKRVDNLLRDVFTGKTLTLWPPRLVTQVTPSSDVFIRGTDLVIHVELPGIDPQKDVTVTIDDGQLIVKGARNKSQEVRHEDYYREEVWHGSFERRVPLPEGMTEEAVEAAYERGMLEVTVHGAAAHAVEEPRTLRKTIPVTSK
jgi:HSP20 family protein